jgi:hypothetical protein
MYYKISEPLQQKFGLVALKQKFTSENTKDDPHKIFGCLQHNFSNFIIKISTCGIA